MLRKSVPGLITLVVLVVVLVATGGGRFTTLVIAIVFGIGVGSDTCTDSSTTFMKFSRSLPLPLLPLLLPSFFGFLEGDDGDDDDDDGGGGISERKG